MINIKGSHGNSDNLIDTNTNFCHGKWVTKRPLDKNINCYNNNRVINRLIAMNIACCHGNRVTVIGSDAFTEPGINPLVQKLHKQQYNNEYFSVLALQQVIFS